MMYLPHRRYSSIMRDGESLNQKKPWPLSSALRPFCSAKLAVVGRYLHLIRYSRMMEVIPINTNETMTSKTVLWEKRIQSFQESGLSRKDWCQQNGIPQSTFGMVAAMYETFFQMEHTPFSRNTPVADLYESSAMADTLGRLAYAADRQLFAVVTADAGCGKSTLIRRFVTSLPKEEYLFLYLSDSKLTPRWFYKGMLDQLGIESKFYRGDAKRQLQKEVEIIRGVQKKKVVCILDEAHLLEKETIEEFRFLLNYRFDSISPMALVLVGQTELWDKLRMQRYAAVRQRIDINCVLPHLDRAETERYIPVPSGLCRRQGRTSSQTKRWMISIRSSTGDPPPDQPDL